MVTRNISPDVRTYVELVRDALEGSAVRVPGCQLRKQMQLPARVEAKGLCELVKLTASDLSDCTRSLLGKHPARASHAKHEVTRQLWLSIGISDEASPLHILPSSTNDFAKPAPKLEHSELNSQARDTHSTLNQDPGLK